VFYSTGTVKAAHLRIHGQGTIRHGTGLVALI
jgi:hypothetical protein